MTAHTPRTIGRYTLLGEIASGGMARVFLGQLTGSQRFSRRVAIKRLHTQYARDAEFLSMFFDEARVAARISSPYVVPVLDFITEGDEAILVMDYVAGVSLATLMSAAHQQGHALPIAVAVRIVYDMLRGLQAAHTATDDQGQPLNIVHRDISPQNVLVGEDGTSRLVDFGIARSIGRLQSTREGQLKGKLAYMAPEQLGGQEVDHRTDLFAAGVVLWEALTSKRLFSAGDDVATFRRVLESEVIPPSMVRSEIPAALDNVVMQALARHVPDRPASAAAVTAALETAVRLASPEQVAEWMRAHVGDTLQAQARLVAEFEREARSSNDAASSADGVLAVAQAWASSTFAEAPTRKGDLPSPVPPPPAESRPAARGIWLWGSAVLLFLAGALVWLLPTRTNAPLESVRPSTIVAPKLAADAAAHVVDPGIDAKIEPRAVKPPPRKPGPPPKRPVQRKAPAPNPEPSSKASRDDCKIPFTIDESGVRIPKRHCL